MRKSLAIAIVKGSLKSSDKSQEKRLKAVLYSLFISCGL